VYLVRSTSWNTTWSPRVPRGLPWPDRNT